MTGVADLRNGMIYEEDGVLLQVLSYEHIKMGRGSANIKIKVRNLKTGSTTEKSFISGARVKEVVLDKREMQYLYKDGDRYYFMDNGTFEQVEMPKSKLADSAKFLKDGMTVFVLMHGGEPLSIELPIKMEFLITEADPDVRGNSATNIYKDATLENGVKIRVPLFVHTGDRIRLDTRTGEYVERVSK